MAKKKVGKKLNISDYKPKKITASHIMLYIVLTIYVVVSVCGLVFVGQCLNKEKYENSAQVLIALFSYIGITVGSGFGFYCNKAKEENKLQITNAKYKMRFELAQKIFKENGNTLDNNSINLLRKLMSDENINDAQTPDTNISDTSNVVSGNITSGIISGHNSMNNNEEGLG